MRLAHQIEQFVYAHGSTTLRELSRLFGVSEQRCREELAEIEVYGVTVGDDGQVLTVQT
jgi:DeoR/GlpR family transcriptional regulator of sugar metabolism